MPEALGSLTMTSDGRWEYTLDNDKAQYLDDGSGGDRGVTRWRPPMAPPTTSPSPSNGAEDRSKIEVIERGGQDQPRERATVTRGPSPKTVPVTASKLRLKTVSGTLTVTGLRTTVTARPSRPPTVLSKVTDEKGDTYPVPGPADAGSPGQPDHDQRWSVGIHPGQ